MKEEEEKEKEKEEKKKKEEAVKTNYSRLYVFSLNIIFLPKGFFKIDIFRNLVIRHWWQLPFI